MKKSKKPEIKISVVTKIDTTEWKFGERFLRTFYDADSRFLPERVGNWEPINTPVESLDACKEYWAVSATGRGPDGVFHFTWDFLWKRIKSIKSSGHVIHTTTIQNGTLRPGFLAFRSVPEKRTNWPEIFCRLCEVTQPKFATMHLFTDRETQSAAYSQKDLDNFGYNDYTEGIADIGLKERGLANLSWATFFGAEYSAEVDVPKLQAHGFSVERIGGGVLITLTPNLFDVMDNFAQFSTQRVELKKLFRPGLFRINDEPKIFPESS